MHTAAKILSSNLFYSHVDVKTFTKLIIFYPQQQAIVSDYVQLVSILLYFVSRLVKHSCACPSMIIYL